MGLRKPMADWVFRNSDWGPMLYESMGLVEALTEECERLKRQLAQQNLDTVRWGRDIVQRFLNMLDHLDDSDEMREILSQAVQDMADEAARLEEHQIR